MVRESRNGFRPKQRGATGSSQIQPLQVDNSKLEPILTFKEAHSKRDIIENHQIHHVTRVIEFLLFLLNSATYQVH